MSNWYKVKEIKKQDTDKFGDIITDGYFASAVSKKNDEQSVNLELCGYKPLLSLSQ